MKNSTISPIRRRHPTSAQLAALTQMVIAVMLIVSLLLLAWWFFQAAERLGGARLFIYLPIAMVGFMGMGIWRLIQAWRMFRRAGKDRRQP